MKTIISIIIAAVVLAFSGSTTAHAYNPYVAPITCPDFESDCVVEYYANNQTGTGYWMARQVNGTTWVRLTMVPGWDNTGVGRITCGYYYSCILDYYKNYPGEGYWMARQRYGTTWVRLTMVNGN
jgi:hypothetical protein